MGKLNINLGNREIKPAKKIEKTHANLEQKKEKKESEIKLYKQKKKPKTTKILGFRVDEDELKKINETLEKEDITLTQLIKEALKEKGVL
ncbi:hypothetical protein [Hydrogenimonas thermophila]|uniref:Ribbon-helix-helix protein, copG family n=1 Tax=Hydrogenimonas thermophila TaxID=223786 RepID=A0A1I5ULQ3_9BACT|nr:hypothetical protein [Hydrogenimonas thermophila]SFP96261.1 hypothetical protein SAMN05216234_1658 [Hydrogenimonas thermophila]